MNTTKLHLVFGHCMRKGLRSLTQTRLLLALNDGHLRAVELGRETGIAPSNITVMLRQLIKLGLVHEKSSRLTPAGRSLVLTLTSANVPRRGSRVV